MSSCGPASHRSAPTFISPWPAIYEVVGRSGAFDYVEFVAEEAPFDLHDLDGIGRAVELFPGMGAMIKVDAALRDFTAARAVNAGFDSVLFADIRTANDARAAVRCIRPETPADGGGLGSKAGRAVGFGSGDHTHYVQPRAEIKRPDQAPFYVDLGVRHFSMGTDLGILANWLRTEGGALRGQLDRLA